MQPNPSGTSLRASLETLRVIVPPSDVILVGAGNGHGFWLQWLAEWGVKNVALYEADKEQFRYLQASPHLQAHWQLHNTLIADKLGPTDFYRASVPSASGLVNPESLRPLWPGIQALTRERLDAVTLDACSSEHAAMPGARWLIIDSAAPMAILRGAARLLDRIHVLVVRAVAGAASRSLPHDCQFAAVEQFARQYKLRMLSAHETPHPEFRHGIFARDAVSMVDQLGTQFGNAEQQARQLAAANARIAELEAQQQQLNLKSVAQAIHDASTDIKRQIAAMLGTQQYLQTGALPVYDINTEGWAVSPDFSFLLIKLLTAKSYDLVIEFGSGYSTALIAKVLREQAKARPGQNPPRQLAFEHLERFQQQTIAYMAQVLPGDPLEFVRVIHAPLAPYAVGNRQEQPYYDCMATLEELRNELPASGHALIVVDGPPEPTATRARYPALPIVTALLPHWRLDFVLDDYRRQGEREIAALWRQGLEESGRNYDFSEVKLTKGACLLNVQPSPARDAAVT